MLDHARSRPQLEICGLLGGSAYLIKSYYPVANISDQPHSSFLMDPAGQIQALRTMREREETLAGIFHSHPEAPPLPSSRDLLEAYYPDVYYFIASMRHPIPELKGFYFDGRRFLDVSITCDAEVHYSQIPETFRGGGS